MTESSLPLLRVKVCGLTRPADAVSAALAGADAVGLVHHRPSPRHVTALQARRLVTALDGRALAVAVLVDPVPDDALAWLETSGAGAVQLCGRERTSDWVHFPHPILRRVPVDARGEHELEAWAGVAALFVLDHPATPGGSGRAVDAACARRLARRAPCLLAGGLSDLDVEARVAAVRPFGVDASSRLERAPGRKDAAAVHAFVLRARDALGAIPHKEAS